MKKIGLQPIPMMDRDKKDEVPQGQVRPTPERSTQRGIFNVSRCDLRTLKYTSADVHEISH